MNGWIQARKRRAFQERHLNPSKYYYRFTEIDEEMKRGNWEDDEIGLFMERIREVGSNWKWGEFSRTIPGRVGYQCSNLWRQLIKDGKIQDYNYSLQNGKLNIITRLNNGDRIPIQFRKYAFKVLQDIPGPYNAGDTHESCPDNFDDIMAQISYPAGNLHYDTDSGSDSDILLY